MNENKDIMYQNLWDTEKAMVRGKFIVLNACIKIERSQIKNLMWHLEELETRSYQNPKLAEKRNNEDQNRTK